jgi:hypothetical protein
MPLIRISEDREPLTLDDLRRNPGMLVGPSDLQRLGLFKSYGAIQRAWKGGRLAQPYRLPGGWPRWEARDILGAIGASVHLPIASVDRSEGSLP